MNTVDRKCSKLKRCIRLLRCPEMDCRASRDYFSLLFLSFIHLVFIYSLRSHYVLAIIILHAKDLGIHKILLLLSRCSNLVVLTVICLTTGISNWTSFSLTISILYEAIYKCGNSFLPSMISLLPEL